jgi:hypothetical protein
MERNSRQLREGLSESARIMGLARDSSGPCESIGREIHVGNKLNENESQQRKRRKETDRSSLLGKKTMQSRELLVIAHLVLRTSAYEICSSRFGTE